MSLSEKKQAVQSLVERLTNEATVRKVFGEPIVVDHKTIIPVAKVILGFGGGYGEGHSQPKTTSSDESDGEQGEGGGLGGGLAIQPQGVIEITTTNTRYIPLSTGRHIAIGIALGFVLGKLLRRRKN
ncbi:hypothetical protein G8759_22170 [Spirosoma aureum]|uniref:Sporulation protein n=1 Tax=Spirosoma aureum TaxID=2692134 RepID=A0A6G9AS17_9BACT|nr:spore germination protein GerW family protein [Spirosoma aureum]QIP15134.1 hypothetical protein G8759_22170 [Spirosoma aureum]